MFDIDVAAWKRILRGHRPNFLGVSRHSAIRCEISRGKIFRRRAFLFRVPQWDGRWGAWSTNRNPCGRVLLASRNFAGFANMRYVER